MISYVLAAGAVVTVLLYGGAHKLAFIPAEFAVIIAAVVQFWRNGFPRVPRPTLCLLATLVAIPLVQLIPLKTSVVASISPVRVALTGSILSTLRPLGDPLPLSINPYETRVALLEIVCYVLVFLLGFQALRSKPETSLLIKVIILLGVVEGTRGMVEYLSGWKYFPIYDRWMQSDVASGSYINRNNYAGLLAMILPFALARLLMKPLANKSSHRSRWKEMIISPLTSHRLGDIVVFIIISLGIVFSRSRMGIVSAVVAVLFVTGLSFAYTRRRSTLLITFFILAVSLGYSLWIGLDPVMSRFELLGQSSITERGRLPIWRDTMAMIRDYPWLGTGLGTYRWASLHYQTAILDVYYDHAHNDYLEFAADIGIPAAILLFAGLWTLALRIARKAVSLEHAQERILAIGCCGAMVAMLTHGFSDYNFQIPANAFIFAWIAGTSAAILRKPQPEAEGGHSVHERKESIPVQYGD